MMPPQTHQPSNPALLKPSQYRRRNVAVHFLREDPSHCYEFIWKRRNGDGSEVYTCKGCASLKKSKIAEEMAFGPAPVVKIADGFFVNDPENPSNPHYCKKFVTAEAMKGTRRRTWKEQLNARQDVRTMEGSSKTRKEVQLQLVTAIDKHENRNFPLDESTRMAELLLSNSRATEKNLGTLGPESPFLNEKEDDNLNKIDSATLLEMMLLFNESSKD